MDHQTHKPLFISSPQGQFPNQQSPPSPGPSASSSGEEGTVSSCFSYIIHVSSPPPTTQDSPSSAAERSRRRSPNFLCVMEVMDEQDLWKHLLLGLAIPVVVSIGVSASLPTIEMRIVTSLLSLAVACIWNGLLLRTTFPQHSPLLLISGDAFMMSAFFTFLASSSTSYLKAIPVLCGIVSLFPLGMVTRAYFQRDEAEDPERGEILTS